jgi:hypothetical protein
MVFMGTYLATGIVQEIVIDKRDIKSKDITSDILQRHLKDKLDITCYNYSENSDQYLWKIKPEIIELGLTEFLDTQFSMYKDYKDKYMIKTLDQLTKAKTATEIILLALSGDLINFQLLKPITHHIRVTRDNGFDEIIILSYRIISYFLDGKIIMETYNNIFRYFEHNIRLQSKTHPIARCVKVMITD